MTQTAFLSLKKAELILCHMYCQRCWWAWSCAGTFLFPIPAHSLLQGHGQAQLSLSAVSIKSLHWNLRPGAVWPQLSTPQHKPLLFKQLNLPMWHDWAKKGKKGSGSVSDFMELPGSKAGTRTGSKQSKQKKKKEKILKRKWNRKGASGRATPIAAKAGQLDHHRTLPWAASQTPHGPKIKPGTQKSQGLFNKS